MSESRHDEQEGFLTRWSRRKTLSRSGEELQEPLPESDAEPQGPDDARTAASPIAEDAGVMMILEPMNVRVDHAGHCLYGSEAALRICDAVDSPAVKINWDLYHMQITEGDLCGRLREGVAAKQVGYLQLADHPGRNACART